MHNAQHDCTERQRTSNYMIGKRMQKGIRKIERENEKGKKKIVKQVGK